MEKTLIELFAGVGGFRIGLEKADENFKTVWANQWEPSKKVQEAYDCYCSHFGVSDNHSNLDINQIDVSKIPNHSLLVGGFPCQDYSVAATGAKGIQGKKGVLWWNIYKILKEKNTPFVLLENVDRLLKSPSKQRGRDFAIILGCLKELNYSVEWRIINAAEYGFAQRRRRVFIFAFKNDTNYAKEFLGSSAKMLVKKDGFFQRLFPTKDFEEQRHLPNTIEFEFNDVKDLSDTFSFRFNNSGCLLGSQLHTEELLPVCESKQIILSDILVSDVPEEYYLTEDVTKWEYMKGSKRIERTHRDGHKYVFSEGAIAFPDSINKPARTMLTSEASGNRSTHIIRDPQSARLRKLTPIECERLNGFPDNWTDSGMSTRFRYFCMGNALIVNLVEIMGKELSNIIMKE